MLYLETTEVVAVAIEVVFESLSLGLLVLLCCLSVLLHHPPPGPLHPLPGLLLPLVPVTPAHTRERGREGGREGGRATDGLDKFVEKGGGGGQLMELLYKAFNALGNLIRVAFLLHAYVRMYIMYVLYVSVTLRNVNLLRKTVHRVCACVSQARANHMRVHIYNG